MRTTVGPALYSSGTDKGPERNTSRVRLVSVSFSPPQRLFLCLEATTTQKLKHYYNCALYSQLFFLLAHIYAENRRTMAEVPFTVLKIRVKMTFLPRFFLPAS